jgi:hypothetical protein
MIETSKACGNSILPLAKGELEGDPSAQSFIPPCPPFARGGISYLCNGHMTMQTLPLLFQRRGQGWFVNTVTTYFKRRGMASILVAQ